MSNRALGLATGQVAKDGKGGGLAAALRRLAVAVVEMASAAARLVLLDLVGVGLRARCGLETVRSAWLSWTIDRQLGKRR